MEELASYADPPHPPWTLSRKLVYQIMYKIQFGNKSANLSFDGNSTCFRDSNKAQKRSNTKQETAVNTGYRNPSNEQRGSYKRTGHVEHSWYKRSLSKHSCSWYKQQNRHGVNSCYWRPQKGILKYTTIKWTFNRFATKTTVNYI
jgi:hypothetical protein